MHVLVMYLDNGTECNLFRVSKCHRCLTIKFLSNIKAFFTCYCLTVDIVRPVPWSVAMVADIL